LHFSQPLREQSIRPQAPRAPLPVRRRRRGKGAATLHVLSVLARKRGIPIVAINPMPERALIKFTAPQDVVQMATFGHTDIASEFVHIKICGDLALFKGMMKVLFERDAAQTLARALDLAARVLRADRLVDPDAARAGM
jgi:anaerobic selenocysteine-containing dehydrogenase